VIAAGVRETDLADYQRAVRTLLVHPLVTETYPDADALPRVRRYLEPLSTDLQQVAGYRLQLEATCVRLVRRVDRLDDTQLVRRRDRKPFDRRRYAYLSLALAALGRAGSQVALTELADALRRRAVEIDGLGFDPDQYRHRLAFVDVVRHLLHLGALREVETSSVDWLRDPDAGEALYDVDRDAVHLVFVPPRVVQHTATVEALLAGSVAVSRDTRRAATRQRLARLLLEHPVLAVDDLTGEERGYLASQATSLAADLHRLTGAQVERRAEGVALIDATGRFSDRSFPAVSTPAQVALLLADAMAHAVTQDGAVAQGVVPRAADHTAMLVTRLDAARPSPPSELAAGEVAADTPAATTTTSRPDGAGLADRNGFGDLLAELEGPPVPTGPFFPEAWLLERLDVLLTTHRRAIAADYRDDPDALLRVATEVLVAFDLVRQVPGGLIARPILARFRDPVVAVAEAPQPSLFGADDAAVTPREPDPADAALPPPGPDHDDDADDLPEDAS
jgi:uncharacterized protein (TIGR02678 family)